MVFGMFFGMRRARLWYWGNLSGICHIWLFEGLKELVVFGEVFLPGFLVPCDGFKKSNVAGCFEAHRSQPQPDLFVLVRRNAPACCSAITIADCSEMQALRQRLLCSNPRGA